MAETVRQGRELYGGISQDEFIAILFVDCGYAESSQRRGWLHARFEVRYADELTVAQKSRAIEMLCAEKAECG